jgi:hypothetical protein
MISNACWYPDGTSSPPAQTVVLRRIPVHGGSIDGPGPVIGGGISSSIPVTIQPAAPGNVLVAFSVDGK